MLAAAIVVAGVDLAAHCRLAGWIGARIARLPAIASTVQFDSARFACFDGSCGVTVDLTGVKLSPPDAPGVNFQARRVRYCPKDGIQIEDGVLRGAAAAPLVSLGRINLTPSGAALSTRIERIAVASLATVESVQFGAMLASNRIGVTNMVATTIQLPDSVVRLDSVSLPSLILPRTPQPRISVPLVKVGVSSTKLERRPDGSWNLPAAAEVNVLTMQLQSIGAALNKSYTATTGRLHSATWWLVFIAFVAVAAAKLALTSAKLWLRALSAAVSVGIAWALDLLGVSSVLLCLAAGVAIAIGLVLAIYRRAPEWHQRIEPAAIDLIAPLLIVFSLAAHRFVFPALPAGPVAVDLAEIQVGETGVSVRDARLGSASVGLVSATISRVSVDGQRVTIDRAQVTDTVLNTTRPVARVRIPTTVAQGISYAPGSAPALSVLVSGTAESTAITGALQSIRYLPAAIRTPGPTPFCVSFQLGTELPVRCGSGTLSIRASADVADLARIRYAADVVARGTGVAVAVAASGEGSRVRLTRIHSEPNSTVKIAGGSGSVDLDRGIRAQLDLQQIEASGVGTENLGLRIDGSSSERINVSGEAQRVHAGSALVRSLGFELHRNGQPVNARVEAREVQLRSAPSIDATLPLARADISGKWLNNRFDGSLTLAATGAGVHAVQFTVDPIAGTLQLVEQVLDLIQTAAPFLPSRVTGHIRGQAAINSVAPLATTFRAAIQLDPLTLRLLPVETRLEELKITAESPAWIAFDSLFSTAYPAMPRALDLEQVGKLNLTTEGEWRGTAFDINALPSWNPRPLPRQFRVSGTSGAPISVVTTNGRLEIGKTVAEIKKLVVRGGQLEQAVLHTELGGLRTSTGPASLNATTDVSLSGPAADISISGALSGVDSFSVTGGTQRLSFGASGIRSDVLWASVGPLLQEFGADVSWLHPAAQLRTVTGELGFSKARLEKATADLEIAPGNLAGVNLKAPLRGLQIESLAPLSLHTTLSPAGNDTLGLELSATSSSLRLRIDGDGGETRATLGVEAQAKGTMSFRETSRTPIMQAAIDTFEALRPQINEASNAFGNGSGTLNWKAEAKSAPGEPALILGDDRWSTKLSTPVLEFSSAGTVVRGSGQITADVVLHRDAVVVDGRIPMHLEYSLPDAPLQSMELDVPMLAAVTRQTPAASADTDALWSIADFNRILEDFTPRNATSVVFDRASVEFPNGVIRQIRIPQPTRLVVGATNPLRIGFPFAGSLLFGSLKGDGQAQLTWDRGTACLTSRVKGELNGLETDSIQTVVQGIAVPAIRDFWNAEFAFGLDGLCLNRNRIAALMWDPISSDLIDRMNLRLHVVRAPHDESDEGVLQMTGSADLKRVNQLLRDLVRQYQWQSMPEAIRYRQFDLALETQGDRVVDRGPVLKMGGIYFSDGRIATGADLRLYLRPSHGDHASVRDLIETLRSIQ